jgi:hypothetical protein
MSVLKLTYCSLIKIILSQIGGNPLQQLYSQLSQGKAQAAQGGLIPTGLLEIKQLIDQVTATINAAQAAAGDFSDVMEKIGEQLYQNPVGASITAAIAGIDARIATVDAGLVSSPGDVTLTAQKAALVANRAALVTFKTNTDRLSGVGTVGAAGAGGCSLQDLLGSGCTPNGDVPDIDLKALTESLKTKDLIDAITAKLTSGLGIADVVTALATFKTTIDGFNLDFNTIVNKAAIRSAVTSQITQIVYNLLSGCGNQVFDLTLKSDVKAKVAVYAAAEQLQREQGVAYTDINGVTVTPTNTETTPPTNNIVVTPNLAI